LDQVILIQELSFKAVKSSGAGGQHVNKTASKVEVQFDVDNSAGLEGEEKTQVVKKLSSRLTANHILILQCGATRSQHKNKEEVIRRFLKIIRSAVKKPKPRKKTDPTKASKLKRLKKKKIKAEKKAHRQNPLK